MPDFSYDGVPDFNIGGTLYSAGSIINQQLFAAQNIPVYDSPGGTQLGTIPAGNLVGQVYSYLSDGQGNIWWEFLDSNAEGVLQFPGDLGSYFTEQLPGAYNLGALVQQGVQSVPQQVAAAAAAANSTWLTDLVSAIKPLAIPIVLIIGGAIVVGDLFKKGGK